MGTALPPPTKLFCAAAAASVNLKREAVEWEKYKNIHCGV